MDRNSGVIQVLVFPYDSVLHIVPGRQAMALNPVEIADNPSPCNGSGRKIG